MKRDEPFKLPCNCGNSYVRSGTRYCEINKEECPVLYGPKQAECLLEEEEARK